MQRDDEEPAQSFKRSTAIAIKALGKKGTLEVAFAPYASSVTDERVTLPVIADDVPAAGVAAVRGAADAASLRLRYHNSVLHAARMPQEGGSARFIFDAMEKVRCEALGARLWRGVAHNLDTVLANLIPVGGVQSETKMDEGAFARVLSLYAYEKFTGRNFLPEASPLQDVLEKADPFLARLQNCLEDQDAFAKTVLQLIASYQSIPVPPPQEKEFEKNDTSQENKESENADEKNDEHEELQAEANQKDTGKEDAEALEAVAGGDKSAEAQDDEKTQTASENALDGPPTTYRVFTTQYDEVVGAEQLCSSAELVRLRALLDRHMRPMQSVIVRLANRLQRLLMAQQRRTWDFDLEEGILDGARLARIVVNPLQALSFKAEKESDFRDTVVTLLLDNSGSMRGRPVTLAAMTADILARTLERCGVKVEILGFTTRAWKGGMARTAWDRAGRPAMPGRLNEIRHIIYKSADAPMRRARANLGLMLREGLLKENIDGEALLWAHRRLMMRGEKRRILMVISDGAPVDDATLSANPGNYLEEHLKSVIAWIEKRSVVELVAIGIGHDVTRTYRRAVTLTDADQLGGAVMTELASLFAPKGSTG